MTVSYAAGAISIMLSILVLLPTAAFCLECLAALLPRRSLQDGSFNPEPTATAVLIPAHNEQLVIEPTLRAVLPTLGAGDRVLVVADNCDDRTAELARRAGAEVIVRSDPKRRGKGFALEYGIQALRDDPPDVVIVLDADCLVAPQTVGVLGRLAHQTQRPVQARNLTDRNPASGPIQAVSLLGNRFTNLIRPRGLLRLGAPCRLMGTGMAIPWRLADSVPLGGDNLVEDMQWGIDLALQGHFPLFCLDARVTSGLPAGQGAFVSQRTRWEHGHLRTAVTQIPRLLATGVRRRSWPLLAMALDLSIPPLTLLVAFWAVGAMVSGLAWRLGASGLPAVLVAGSGAAIMAAFGLGWVVFCRRQVPLRAAVAVPHYMLRKLPIYTGFLFRRQRAWVRTERVEQVANLPEMRQTGNLPRGSDAAAICDPAGPSAGEGIRTGGRHYVRPM